MTDKFVVEKLKGYNVEYTKRSYYGANYYYLHSINNIVVPNHDAFPKKKCLIDFVNCYHETKDVKLSLKLGFRPGGMSIKDAINLINNRM